jgi:hypothetical protein
MSENEGHKKGVYSHRYFYLEVGGSISEEPRAAERHENILI